MELQKVKRSLSAAWVTVVFAIGLVAGVTSWGAIVALIALGLLPPLALLLLWNDPPETLSESIQQGRR